MWHYKLNQYTI